MLTLRKRGRNYHVDMLAGVSPRIRASLGTRNQNAALRLLHRLEIAISEGPNSQLWAELKKLLPAATYSSFAAYVGVKELPEPTWTDVDSAFRAFLNQRIALGKLRESTRQRYTVTLREFNSFLAERKVSLVRKIDGLLVEDFKTWRLDRIKKHKFSRAGAGLVLDIAILHRIFTIAIRREMAVNNPVRMEGSPGENPANGAQPFGAQELMRLREYAGDDLLALLMLRWTGFRGSDATSVPWTEVRFEHKEFDRVSQKRMKRVILPIHPELLCALEAEYEKRKPQPNDPVLLNPTTGKPLTRPRLYQRMIALGKRAKVANCHPHRFRDTFAVDMLLRGGSPYDVAKMLGDTIETVEKHYMPFVRELRERVRSLLENGAGLESTVTPASQSSKEIQ